MDLKSKTIQRQYEGYLSTPLLWEGNSVMGLKQFQIPPQPNKVFNEELPNNLRLGKRVERFVSFEISQVENIDILIENPQIQNEKITVGEIDCLLKQDEVPIHLEVVYKFYLYDKSVGTSEIEHWIGPNRRDTLVKKLQKLKEKQLPILYNPYTKPTLDSVGLTAEEIQQYVLFKAQLFLPYNKEDVEFSLLNPSCIKGYYISLDQLVDFKDCKFHIPPKNDWLLEVETQINWQRYSIFTEKLNLIIKDKTSPLCWIKFPNGKLEKIFIVWW